MKICSKCKRALPETREFFYKCKKGKNGLYPSCIECEKIYAKAHYNKPEVKEKRAIYEKEYRDRTKEQRKNYMREYRKKNRKYLTQKNREYIEQNRKQFYQYGKEYRKKNKEAIAKRDKQYREKNKERINLHEKMYRQTENGKNARYNGQLKRRTYKHFKKFTPVERTKILERDKWQCKSCGIKVHDRSSGNWNTPDKAHIDHIIPISKGGNSEPNNLQILCRKCNISKGNKIRKEVIKNEKIGNANS